MAESFGRYEIISELGKGGMATVYRARDPDFGREVAVKVLPRALLHDATFVERFRREARTIAALEHSAIVPVYDFGERDEQPFLVMRYMSGGSLADQIARGPKSIHETATILERIAPALDWAHSQGIVHRDIKPGNVLFDRYGEAYLSDFGIARLAEGGGTLTGSGIIGTPAYMSPEQGRGDKHIDGRTDVYALGAVAFEMLTGRQPYEADTPMGLVVKHITEPTPRIRSFMPDLPAATDRVIDRAMAKDPAARYATGAELVQAVAALRDASSRLDAGQPAALAPTVAEAEPPAQTVVERAPEATVHEPPPRYVPPSPGAGRASGRESVAPTAHRRDVPLPPRPRARRRRRRVPIWVWLLGLIGISLLVVGVAGGALIASGMLDGLSGVTPQSDQTEIAAIISATVGAIPTGTLNAVTAADATERVSVAPATQRAVAAASRPTETPPASATVPPTLSPATLAPTATWTLPPPTLSATATITAAPTRTFTPTFTPTLTPSPTPSTTSVVTFTVTTGADGTNNNPILELLNASDTVIFSAVLDQPGDLQPFQTDVYTFNAPGAFCDFTGWHMTKPASPGGEDPWEIDVTEISVNGSGVWFNSDHAHNNPFTSSSFPANGGWSGTQSYQNECS